ncbi:NAD(P)-dependent oxidoreductase [Paenibacillus sp. GSMTC-2017]|uniref:NAD-dependent epimerase/dehydratase family protein n=1 Tax=Paenibacillus sp. GSMTC-2017 TaxID=2794350 RepID=UPI0018D9F72C|nr:NAD(P)-dependent oxidoreductase [Paenibacillus sp. GSMTC-2017]MBH5320635.1 NAD(P)-dependent oxidoreductase [Paenibacillus sp. GSMTC-2017]
MKKIIVTGANGFVGKQVMELLQHSEYHVYALTSHIGNKQNSERVTWFEVNLLDERQITALFDQLEAPTHLLHLAWDTTPGLYWNSATNFQWVKATLSLVDLFCAAGGGRIVAVGTCAEYDLNAGICREDDSALAYTTMYGSCKNALQHMLSVYAQTHAISVSWARLFYMYGPHEHPSRLVPSVIQSLMQGVTADCSHGKQIRDYMYVKDVASALVALLESDLNGPINVASGIPYLLKDIVNEIGELMKKPDLVRLNAIRSPEGEPPIILADMKKMTNLVGWKPSYSLKEGLIETIEWWRKQEITR